MSKGAVDIYILLHRYATDVIAEFTYGPHGATKSLVDPTAMLRNSSLYHIGECINSAKYIFPTLRTFILKW